MFKKYFAIILLGYGSYYAVTGNVIRHYESGRLNKLQLCILVYLLAIRDFIGGYADGFSEN